MRTQLATGPAPDANHKRPRSSSATATVAVTPLAGR